MGKNSKAQQAEERRKYLEELRRREQEKIKRQNRLMWQIVIGVVAIVLVISAVALAISLGGKNQEQETETGAPTNNAVPMSELDLSSKDIGLFSLTEEVTDYVKMNVTYTDRNGVEKTGDIVVRLFPEVAPKTVANFQSLVKKDFYNGLTFHRVVEGFMIQGGDPDGDGTGDSGTTIKGEFTENGFANNLKHNRGVISMARGSYSMDSASCQFFIVHEESQNNHLSLDGKYASFGYVVYGMDTVDGIAETEVVMRNGEKSSPVNPITINDVSFVKLAQ